MLPPSNVLEAIYALGERMQTALDQSDLEGFFALAGERGTVLDKLNAYVHPAEVDPDWRRLAKAVAEQQETLLQAAAAHERRLGETLVELERFKHARQHYRQQPRGGGSILNDDLRG